MLKITDVERITVHVPFTPRSHIWCAREQYQWGISEVVRVTTDVPDLVGYGETMPHYTWGRVSDEAIARVKGRTPAEFFVAMSRSAPVCRWRSMTWWAKPTECQFTSSSICHACANGVPSRGGMWICRLQISLLKPAKP